MIFHSAVRTIIRDLTPNQVYHDCSKKQHLGEKRRHGELWPLVHNFPAAQLFDGPLQHRKSWQLNAVQRSASHLQW
jgi:hypothetical protein